MSKKKLKSELHLLIDKIENEETLMVLNESFQAISKDMDILDELSPAQQARLQSSVQQAKDGKVVNDSSVKYQIQAWLTK